MIKKINELCKALGLEKVQTTCPKCSNSYISLYKLVDANCHTKLIACYCNKCNHEWITEDLRIPDKIMSPQRKYIGTFDTDVEYRERPKKVFE